MKNGQDLQFNDFLDYFPEVELPVELTEENLNIFNKENRAFSEEILEQFIFPFENDELDNMTEFVPCFKIPETHEFHAIIYWKASLLRHEYIIVSYSKKGEIITRKSIAGMISDGAKVTKSVAHIDPEWIITIIVGESAEDGKSFNPQNAQPMSMELLATGDIIFSLQDKEI